MDKKTENYLDYVNLSPTSNASDIQEYSDTLDYCLKRDDILNIAISGTYGSGKSSFIKTYFSNKNKNNTITISLGNYEKDKTKKQKNKENEYYQSIEKSILQQLLYQVDESEVPLSRFKRINKYSKRKLFFKCCLYLILFLILLIILFPDYINILKDNFTTIKENLSFIPNKTILKKNINGDIALTIILFLSSLGFIMYLFYKIVEFLRNRISINKFKFKDAEIVIDNKSESIFNKYLDEIIYFFQATKFNVVIIEDLDRFNDSTFIIQKLKELNQLINSSAKIDVKIKFIFAIKDDFFSDAKERTKFFDKIIPIIPISSYSNSNEIIWGKFENIYGKKNNYGNITKKFIDDISIFVDDMRIINNIMSEYIIYHDKFIKKNLDDRKLFAMIMYKNLYPKEYSELLIDRGKIPNTFKNVGININDEIKEITNNVNTLKRDKLIATKEELHSVAELKHALVASLVDYNYSCSNQYFLFDNKKVTIAEFLDEEFDIERFNNEKVEFKHYNYSTNILTEEETFIFFQSKNTFVKRLEVLNETKEKKIEKLQQEIEKNLQKIKTIKEKNLKELISMYGADRFIVSENKLEIFLLSRGYITNDYNDYISIFKEGNLKYNDMRFIKAVKKNEKLEYTYHLERMEEIILRMDPLDFCNENILNIDLIDFLISKNNTYSNELEKIFSLFINIDDNNYEFIEQYENFGLKFEEFIKKVIIMKNNFWDYLYTNKIGNTDYIDKWIIRYLQHPKSLNNIDIRFNNYVNEHKNIFKNVQNEQLSTIISSLKQINIKFTCIDNDIKFECLDEIYNNNLYELNQHMIKIILEEFDINYENASKKILTIVYKNEDLKIMKEYIISNFLEFINKFYLNINEHNDDPTILIEILNSSYLSKNEKNKIIEKENVKFENIQLIDPNLYDSIISCNKLKYNLINVIELYKVNEILTADIIKIINSNQLEFDELSGISDKEIINKFEYSFIIENDILNDIYQKATKRFNPIDIFDNNKLEDDKLKILIDDGIIEFNKSNFNYIKENYQNLLFRFINKNLEDFKLCIEELDISNVNLLFNNEISNEIKQYIINEGFVDLISFDDEELYNFLLENNIEISNVEVDEKIMESNIDNEKKIKYLFKNKTRLDSNKLKEYINLLGTNYSNIGGQWNAANIDYNSYMIELLEILKKNRLISSYKEGKKNNIIIYNKR